MTDDFSWGTRTRTRKDRTRICSVANYTIPQSFTQLFRDALPFQNGLSSCLRLQSYDDISVSATILFVFISKYTAV